MMTLAITLQDDYLNYRKQIVFLEEDMADILLV